jgi:hypothetical protein
VFCPHLADDLTAAAITDACVPGCRWLVRVIDRDGNHHNGDRWALSALEDIAAGLPLRPFRVYRDGDTLRHPPDNQLQPEITAGVVEAAWLKGNRIVLAVVHVWHHATRLHRALLALEARGRGFLHAAAGVSLVARVQTHPQHPTLVVAVPSVIALDLVSRPAAPDAGFIRSHGADEVAGPAHTQDHKTPAELVV